jgi:hypothetical protein
MKNNIVFILFLFGLMSCETSSNKSKKNISGEADFSKFIAIGESYSAGNVKTPDQQKESPMAILAGQFAKVGGGEFKIPLNAYSEDVSNGGPYQNLAVPSTSSYHVIDKAFSSKSTYFKNLSSKDDNSILDEVVAQKDRTFFSIWIGGNDLVQYSSQGGLGVVRKADDPISSYNPIVTQPDGSKLTTRDLTAPETFDKIYSELVDKFMEGGSQGILASLSNVIDLPFFTAIPSQSITLTQKEADQLNLTYKAYNKSLERIANPAPELKTEIEKRKIVFKAGDHNGAVIIDEDLTALDKLPKYRQANSEDIILLTAKNGMTDASVKLGTKNPMDDQYVLIPSEIKNINDVTRAYNNTIKRIADEKKLAYVNLDSIMNQLKSPEGLVHEGVKYTSQLTGGFFSMDALPNGRGNAFMCNEFIKAINIRYKTKIPLVNPNSYQGNPNF